MEIVSDGAPEIYKIKNNGTVDYYMTMDKARVVNNYFNGYKVKDITQYTCEGAAESRKTVITVFLEDGTTKKIEK